MIGSVVKSRGQTGLADNGRREWDSEIVKSLDDEFSDWNDPKTTYMIPEELHKQGNDGEKAEKVVFNLLKSFGEQRNEPMFVVHSFSFKERISDVKSNFLSSKKWNIGEHDFVLIHRQVGFVFLQVKSAVKTAKVYNKAQKQLEKDRDSMKFFLEEVGIKKTKISQNSVDKLFSRFPGFVVMPNCPRPNSKASTYVDGIFQEDCANEEAFSKWWDTNIGTTSSEEYKVTEEMYNLLVQRFVGLVLISRCLVSGNSIDDSFKALQFNTIEQLKVQLDSSADRWIVGPAGSGKTCLLMEKVIILANEIISEALDQRILVVCYNKPLSLMLSRKIEHELKVVNQLNDEDQSGKFRSVVDVKTFDKLLKDINGSFNVKDDENHRVEMALERLKQDESSALRHSYNHIFVDEGQDLYNAKWPSLLKLMHKCSSGHPALENYDLNPRYFWVFYDSNQHLHLSKETFSPHSLELSNSKRLHQVLRNTKNVFLQCSKYFEPLVKCSHPVGVYHREVGLEVTWDDSLQSGGTAKGTNGEKSIANHVQYLKRNDVENADICVLVRDEDKKRKVISKLSQDFKIACQNAEELWTKADNNKVVVETVRRFKGLESKVVILYNPPYHDERKTRELLYTAISRCSCYLVVISTQEGCRALQSKDGFISGMPSGCSKPSQVLYDEHVESRSCNSMETAGTSMEPPAKRHALDDDDSHYNQLYKGLKMLSGCIDGHLLQLRHNSVKVSVRKSEFNKLLPSVWEHLQLFPEYKDVNRPALGKIVAILEYRVLQRSNPGNYLGNMESKRQEINASTKNKDMDADVAGVLGLPKPSGAHR